MLTLYVCILRLGVARRRRRASAFAFVCETRARRLTLDMAGTYGGEALLVSSRLSLII